MADNAKDECFTFSLNPAQMKKFRRWSKRLPQTTAAAREQFEFRFLPHGLGECVSVHCIKTGKTLDLTESEKW